MTKQELINQLKASKVFLDKSSGVLTDEDSGVTPAAGMMTAAQQIAHIAQTADWFIEGVFGSGFDMNFEEAGKAIGKVTSITDAREWCTRSYDAALKKIEATSEDDLNAKTPKDSIMGATPKVLVLAGIGEHTAHHRGALTVYTRVAGKVPVMPYM